MSEPERSRYPGLLVAYQPARSAWRGRTTILEPQTPAQWSGMGLREAEAGYLAQNLIRNAQVRTAYNDAVVQLDRTDTAGRNRLKNVYRPPTPAPERAAVFAARGRGDANDRGVNANKPNARVSKWSRIGGYAGHGSAALSGALGAAEIAAAEDKPRAVAGVLGSIGGGIPGGVAGGELGAVIGGAMGAPLGGVGAGPGALVGSVVGALAGAGLGGEGGRRLLEAFYDVQLGPHRTRMIANRASLPRYHKTAASTGSR